MLKRYISICIVYYSFYIINHILLAYIHEDNKVYISFISRDEDLKLIPSQSKLLKINKRVTFILLYLTEEGGNE